jgi:hypothetical protein
MGSLPLRRINDSALIVWGMFNNTATVHVYAATEEKDDINNDSFYEFN